MSREIPDPTFSEWGYTVPAALAGLDGAECISYSNDACPSYAVPGGVVFVDHADPDLREMRGPRFTVIPNGADGWPFYESEDVVETDDLAEALRAIRGLP